MTAGPVRVEACYVSPIYYYDFLVNEGIGLTLVIHTFHPSIPNVLRNFYLTLKLQIHATHKSNNYIIPL